MTSNQNSSKELDQILSTLGLEYHRAMPSSVGGRRAVRKAVNILESHIAKQVAEARDDAVVDRVVWELEDLIDGHESQTVYPVEMIGRRAIKRLEKIKDNIRLEALKKEKD